MSIHSTVILDEGVEIGSGVSIDAYSIVRVGSIIGDGTVIGSGVEIAPYTKVGRGNVIFKGVYLGACPQDRGHLSCGISDIMLEIGDNNVIREYVNIHHGISRKTLVGDNNFFMAHSHVGHDCEVSDYVTLANYSGLGGYVEVGDYAFISGHSLVHQRTRVGKFALVGGLSAINQDVPPYSLVASEYGKLAGLNIRGIVRGSGLSGVDIVSLKKLFKLIFRSGYSLSEVILEVESRWDEFLNIECEFKEIISFIGASSRGVIRKWRG